jgi:hypothetical protein
MSSLLRHLHNREVHEEGQEGKLQMKQRKNAVTKVLRIWGGIET